MMNKIKRLSSSTSVDANKEYLYEQFKYLRRENSPIYGVSSPADIRLQSITFDELCFLLSSEGTHLILFGGAWCGTTASVIDHINFQAQKYNVDTVYLFDFRVGGTSDSSIREDLTARPDYDGPDKAERSVAGAVYNHLYGEVVTRFLTNLNDWVAYQVGTANDITYMDVEWNKQTVPKVQVPFLFLYNKDNKVDHSGAVRGADYVNGSGTYPIVYGFERMCWRDEQDGKLYADPEVHDETTLVKDYGKELENAIFSHIGEDGLAITPYSHSDYLRDACRRHTLASAVFPGAKDTFEENEPIHIQPVTLDELKWILGHQGTFLVLFGGAWCGNTRAAFPIINDYAVANDVKVYLCDPCPDSKHASRFWNYPVSRGLQISSGTSPLKRLYVELIKKYLPNLTTTYSPNAVLHYTDEEGKTYSVGRMQVPHLLAVNKETVDRSGNTAPILAYCERMYSPVPDTDDYIFSEPNYKDYTAGVYKVFYEYCRKEGLMPREPAIDRIQRP